MTAKVKIQQRTAAIGNSKERKVFNITTITENVFTASKYEKEVEEYLEKLYTEEQTLVTRWMHMQSSRERTSTTFQGDKK